MKRLNRLPYHLIQHSPRNGAFARQNVDIGVDSSRAQFKWGRITWLPRECGAWLLNRNKRGLAWHLNEDTEVVLVSVRSRIFGRYRFEGDFFINELEVLHRQFSILDVLFFFSLRHLSFHSDLQFLSLENRSRLMCSLAWNRRVNFTLFSWHISEHFLWFFCIIDAEFDSRDLSVLDKWFQEVSRARRAILIQFGNRLVENRSRGWREVLLAY